VIERPELDEHFDEGRFPGLRRHPPPSDETLVETARV
jgi:hypothetical protein